MPEEKLPLETERFEKRDADDIFDVTVYRHSDNKCSIAVSYCLVNTKKKKQVEQSQLLWEEISPRSACFPERRYPTFYGIGGFVPLKKKYENRDEATEYAKRIFEEFVKYYESQL